MCGIAGLTQDRPGLLEEMAERLAHRGPDSSGIWRDDTAKAGFAHRRLAVIDLSPAAAQPMVSDCGRYVLVHNGEIYNFRELRRELEALGERFRSESDTEVLLKLLRRDGEAALSRLIGMFAFAFWDTKERSLLIARDRLGIKPLVYAPLSGGQLAFASEIHALRAHPQINVSLDFEAVSEYLACLYVPAPRTIHVGIRKLAPGHVLKWRNGKTEIKPYWQPRIAGEREIGLDEAVEEILPLLKRAVVDRMVADVPLGCFLSGGIDSSVIAAIMAEEAASQGAPPIRSFTMTFEEKAYDERDAARRVAGHISSTHTELPAGSAFVDRLDDYVRAFGEPFGNPTALLIDDLSRKAREHVTVALVGDGGDEVFAGYPRYAGGRMAQRYRRVPGGLRRKLIAPLAELIPESSRGRHGLRRAREFLTGANLPDAEMYASWVEYFSPEERQALMGGAGTPPERPIARLYETAPSSDPLDAMQQTDLQSFLPGNLLAYGDAMSMQHALELRLPLIDHRLIEAVGRLAPELRFHDGLKTLLKAAADRLLPAEVLNMPKRGFNPPMGIWLKSDLAPMVAERINRQSMHAVGLNWTAVKALLDEHHGGRRDHALKIWALLVLDAWRTSVA
ncbi:MAG: asparagine synthase (glutamine-hydrolyzing) [Rhodospirillales bacterium]|nr:asparagine synthase (glutamine-hydrolyzing) [Rhodospirillales bacterium]